MSDINHDVELDYNYIDDGIYIGTNQCCKTHFDELLTGEGITNDISFEDQSVDRPYGVESYVWIPVADDSAPTMDQLEFGVQSIFTWVSLGKKLYAHCVNGHGRAPTFVIGYFIKKGVSLDDALTLVKSKRPAIHPVESQLEALRLFEKKIKQ